VTDYSHWITALHRHSPDDVSLHKLRETRHQCLWSPVVWSETVGLTTRPVWDKKLVLVLVLQVWCCIVKQSVITLVVIMILKDIATFQVLFIVSLFCAWTSLLWRSTVAFTYLKV